MRAPLLLCCSLLLAAGAASAQEETPTAAPAPATCAEPSVQESVRVMALDLRAEGDLSAQARSLSQVVAEETGRVSGYHVLSSEEVRAVLDQESTKQLMGCDESSCLAELAGALDADLLVSGTLEKTADGAPIVTLSLLNTRAIVTVNRVSFTWRGEAALFPEVVRAAAQKLVFEKGQRPPGTLVVEQLPDGATVTVDDIDRTHEHASGAVRHLDVGPHEVRLSAPGHGPRTAQILVEAGKEVRVDGALEALPVTSSWWFWGGAGAAVVAGVGATVAVLAMTAPANLTTTGVLSAPGLDSVEAVK
jgi:hypothetical protein